MYIKMPKYVITCFLFIISILLYGCGNSEPVCVPQTKNELSALTDSLQNSLDLPDDLTLTAFSGPDTTPSPAVLAASADGEVYVGVDMMGSLGKKMGRGAVVRLVDCNKDGIMDSHTTFASMDNPRGIIAIGEQVFVLHTTFSEETKKASGMKLVIYQDTNDDGIADGPPKNLIEHISNPNYLRRRGTDHSTNGIRMGIDGWIYIAVGDFGFHNATDRAGNKLTMLGGGIVRVRPDGTEMEVYTHGTRNIYDLAIDPYMNIFTHGNTNDGGGWNVRFLDHIQSGEYGYPTLFKHFTEEIIPALVDMGGGSGTGGLYLDDDRWPEKYNNTPMMADWGRSYLYIHHLEPQGGSFTQSEEPFIELPQITDVDIDGSGIMYLSAWDGAGYSGDSTKGFTARVVPNGMVVEEFPEVDELSIKELADLIKSGNAKIRLEAQYELLQRSSNRAADLVWQIADDKNLPADIRTAAIFTYSQLKDTESIPKLVELTKDDTVREFALRALADRLAFNKNVPVEPFFSALKSASDRVKIAAIVGLSRLKATEAVPELLDISLPPSFERPPKDSIGPHATPNAAIIPAHVAVKSLVKIGETEPLLDAIETDKNELALWTLRYLHKPDVVQRLIKMFNNSNDLDWRKELMHSLARIYHKEAPYDATWWWGTRPDTHGPYYVAEDWESTPLIRDFFLNTWKKKLFEKSFFAYLNGRYRLGIDEFGGMEKPKPETTEPVADLEEIKNKKGQVGKTSIEDVMLALKELKGDQSQGKTLFTEQGCVACHNVEQGGVMKGPYLGQIGGIMNREQIAESILKPNASISQGFATVQIDTEERSYTGFVTKESANSLVLRNIAGAATTINKQEVVSRRELDSSMMPTGLANALSYQEFVSLVDFLSKQTQ